MDTVPEPATAPNTILVDKWLGFVRAEYLSTFIREGGASVKFVVTPEGQKGYLTAAFKDLCRESGYLFVELDAARQNTRAHMPQDIFFRLAEQVNWRLLARRVILRLAEGQGYLVKEVEPTGSGNVFAAIAADNGLDAQFVLQEVRPALRQKVSLNLNMAKDFRVAMTQLCLAENTRGTGEYEGQPLLNWLDGSNRRIGDVGPFSIYTAINRTTARYFIESALYWIHYAGYSGTVALFDNSRVTVNRDPKDGLRYYTRAMTVEHYELLREFIDGVDRLTGTLLVVATNQDFLEGEAGSRSRGYGIYPALQARVMDDVRDRNLVNPAASLIRLS